MSGSKRRTQTASISHAVILLSIFIMTASAQKQRSVPETVYSNPTSIAVNTHAGGPAPTVATLYPSTIEVSGMTGVIMKVTVTLRDFSNTTARDMDFLLVSPTGVKYVFLSDAGSVDLVTDKVYTLDDNAAFGVCQCAVFNSGTFRPTNFEGSADVFPAPAPAGPYNEASTSSFATTFNNGAPNGTWSLYAVDDTIGGGGSINSGWSITITTDGAPVTFTNASYIGLHSQGTPASPYGTAINVSGVSGVIYNLKVNVTGFSHGDSRDVDMLLVSPNGKGVILMSDGGGNNAVNADLTFDDSAAGEVPSPVVTGTYRPTDNYGNLPHDFFPAPAPIRPYHQRLTNALSNFYGFSPNGEWRLYVVDDGAGNTGSISGGWSLDITATPVIPPAQGANNLFDWNGDGRTDFSVYRPSQEAWYVSHVLGGIDYYFSRSSDMRAPADYDGDRKTDYGLYRPENGIWMVHSSLTKTPVYYLQFGLPGDIPVPADYDGDGRADIAVWRPSDGNWYVRRSTDNVLAISRWGLAGDRPIAADFDGDKKADFAVYRPSTGVWYVFRSLDGQAFIVQFGLSEDKTVVGDYDGDAKADVAVWRPSTGVWWILRSSDFGVTALAWGLPGDLPIPGDYEVDGRFDLAVYRPSDGFWYVLRSSDGGGIYFPWGNATDIPSPNFYVR